MIAGEIHPAPDSSEDEQSTLDSNFDYREHTLYIMGQTEK